MAENNRMNIEKYDYIIIGAGFCGSVLARKIAEEKQKKVLVLERREHIAGNMYDYIDQNEVLVQKYGPHNLHTNHEAVYQFVQRFGEWEAYYLKCGTHVAGMTLPMPFNSQAIDALLEKDKAKLLKLRLQELFGERKTVSVIELLQQSDEIVREYAKLLFELDYKPYAAKQWNLEPEEIDVSILQRVPIRLDDKEGYFDDKYQCLPKGGFTHFFQKLLVHPNIDVIIGVQNAILWEDAKKEFIILGQRKYSGKIIYTGAIDELYQYCFGILPYRTVEFSIQRLKQERFQEMPVVAYPEAIGYTRITDYAQLPVQNKGCTTIVYEYPRNYLPQEEGTEPFYPIINENNRMLYQSYLKLAEEDKNLILCGRLADYRYYNMDEAILRAFQVYDELDK